MSIKTVEFRLEEKLQNLCGNIKNEIFDEDQIEEHDGFTYVDYCKKECIKLLEKEFNDISGINWDEVQIWGEVVSNELHGSKWFCVVELRFGNLYSYVLSQNIPMSYDKWVYDTEMESDERTHRWNKTTYKGITTEEVLIGNGIIQRMTVAEAFVFYQKKWEEEKKDNEALKKITK